MLPTTAAADAAPAAVLLGDACERILAFLDVRDLAQLACASKACAARVRPKAALLRRRHLFFTDAAGLTAVLSRVAAHGTVELAAPRLVCKAWCRFDELETVREGFAWLQAPPGEQAEEANRPPRPRFLQ